MKLDQAIAKDEKIIKDKLAGKQAGPLTRLLRAVKGPLKGP